MLSGRMIKVPTLISLLENEATWLVPFDPKGINETLANEILTNTFICVTSKNAK
ncbi:hypothetical protein FS749_015300 [Ceratobasidium sp. UAMH 11750]|nr:hypothetical protein FS749_015300 [Ceratobasidium sp. UAMH 11750]